MEILWNIMKDIAFFILIISTQHGVEQFAKRDRLYLQIEAK